jgi:dTDP-3-amino-2,3,6-trideoxy-4-keto-D-glucose/dTDP-3-amino-3,4,6-trideoxy-alpha-D-glucose/dTDP-2,6-dideoxy-D-kanosamine transaminase
MPVHYAGHAVDMDKVMDIAKKHNLHIVEDSCQSISAKFNGKNVGTFGITGAFSLHPLKNLNVWGDSGIIVTDSDEMCYKLRLIRNHGLVNRDVVEIFGVNSRLDSLQAIVGNHLIKDIHFITEKRIQWAQKYDDELSTLSKFITIPERRKNKRYVFHLYIMLVQRRDELLDYLNSNGIEAKVHYPIPLHLQPAAKYLGYKQGDFPVAEAQAKSILTLPVHQHLTEDQVDYVISKIKEFYK